MSEHSITKASLFDFLLLMMYNIGHQSEKKVESLLAHFLHLHFYKLGLYRYINSDENSDALGASEQHQQILTIPVQSEISTAVELIHKINTFLQRLNSDSFQKLIKLVQGFKQEHKVRFTKRIQYFNSKDRSKDLLKQDRSRQTSH
jgi:hypothetical protein